MEEMKTNFVETMNKYFTKCIPLTQSTKEIFFLSPTNAVIGFDIKHGSFFEPNSTARFSLIHDALISAFDEKVVGAFETIYQQKFTDLTELKVKMGAQTKYIGLRAFYSKEKNAIYVWNFFNSKWDVQDSLTNRQYFSNCEIIPTEKELEKQVEKPKPKIEYYESLDDLGIVQEDLEKMVNARFRDGSTHYHCKKLNSVVSFQFINKYWYVPDKQTQSLILSTNTGQESSSE